MKHELMNAHRTLAVGSPDDMKAARLILRLLRNRRITLYLSDAEWKVQTLLEDLGIPLAYSRNGCRATASI